MAGHGSQVVKVLIDHTYQLDEKVLEQVLLKPEIKDLPVVVVSVAGAYRGGKSFLLNFFIRYLSSPQGAQQDGSWLGENSAPLVGFNWRGGAQRNTTGILLWSEPFVTTLQSGEKVAIILMDTQGTFDSKSTVRDNSTIFALSTLLSTVQIYNLSMNIQEDDMQHLQLFTMYGKMVQEKNHVGKPFQTLEFLVRDWPYPHDYTFGSEGGTRLLQERLELDEKLLEQVLLKPEIKDLPVVVVSVAGAFRGGKSFLLNFFLRFLTSLVSTQQDGSWLSEDSEPLTGFDWRGGSERNTTGILLWSQPFITTIASGEKVAVLLMDTQGTFDSKSTVRDNSTIFALSTLVSSVQIYNLSMNIQEDDLQHLLLFTMYGKMVQERNDAGKAFQTLGFLVRDWPYHYEHPFGAEGGKQLLQKRLMVTPNLPEELRELRKHLGSSFENIFCFLMPHPGFKVQDSNFKGQISDIELNFRKHLKVFVPSLLSSEKLCPKTINGQRIKAGELFNYFKAYMTLFNSDQIPKPRSIVQATVEAGLLSAANEAREVYEKEMNAECGPTQPALPLDDLQDLHRKYLNAARETFTSKKTMASHVEVNKCLDKLTQDLQNRLSQFEQSNLSKLQATMKQANDVYEEIINNISQPICMHPLDLDKVHKEAVQAAFKVYEAQVKVVPDKPDQKRAELTQTFQSRHVHLMLTNDNNNKAVVKELFMEYQNFMNSKSTNPPLSEAVFKEGHDAGLKQALDKFQTKRNCSNSYPNDIYKEDLEKTILGSFWQLEAINNSKIEQERKRQEDERIRQKAEKERQEAESQRREQERIMKEQEAAANQQEREKMLLELQRLEIENQMLRDDHRNDRNNNVFSLGLGIVSRLAGAVITKVFK